MKVTARYLSHRSFVYSDYCIACHHCNKINYVVTATGEGGGTFSHPWTAAPAWIIPRFLMGIRPLADGWRRVAIRPLPGRLLRSASITVLTPRGVVSVAFDATVSTFSATITVPGNTIAQICLPRYLFEAHALCTVSAHGAPVSAKNAGALLCLREDVGGGIHLVTMAC